MGIGGHVLSTTHTRKLAGRTGLPLDRAYRRGQETEGRVIYGGKCFHFAIDFKTGAWQPVNHGHWSSCPPRER